VRLRLYAIRLDFQSRSELRIPSSGAGNLLRGAFGAALRRIDPRACARLFEPLGRSGPSGFIDRPRPFVFRVSHLDGALIPRDATFHAGFHLFEMQEDWRELLARVFDQLFPARLIAMTGADEPLVLPLEPCPAPVDRVIVRFLTPAELKSSGGLAHRPEFAVLAARIRDRISMLRQLYDDGPLALDFAAFGRRAAAIRMTRCEIQRVAAVRRSRRTGQVHPLGGFTGEAEYAGDLAEFVPFLKAAEWTGVGRQTAWGKGALAVQHFPRREGPAAATADPE
jgi:hypothetical protein